MQNAQNRVIMLSDAAHICGVSKRTLQRYIENGTGPALVTISPRRIGVFEADLNAWLLSRRRAAPGSDRAA